MSAVPPDRVAATEAAAQWHVLQREGRLSQAQQRRFMDWLVASPEHLREYLAVARVAGDLHAVLTCEVARAPSARHGNVVQLPLRNARAPVRASGTRGWRRLAACIAGLACLGVAGFAAWPTSQRYVAAHGAPRSFALPDHTVVHLNAESALSMRYSLFDRRVELERGQASFVVAKDVRPFAVHAAGLKVRDIGTTFDVSLLREQVRIDVAEGRVRVIGDAGEGRLLADLQAGQRAEVDYRSDAVAISQEDPQSMTAWWQRRVVFRDEPLLTVVDRFNRLNRLQLQVDDATAGELRLTGNLRGDDLASLRAFLDDQPALVTHASADAIHIASRLTHDKD